MSSRSTTAVAEAHGPNRGALAGLSSAVLFGAGTPVAKLLLGEVGPWLLAGLLYTASGVGLFCWRWLRRAEKVQLARHEVWPLAGAVLFGGALGPLLLMMGLTAMPASSASLLLNAEGVFTAVIAWLVFREATDARMVAGFVLIAAGAVVLSWPSQVEAAALWPSLAVLGACLCWGIDNNLTRQVSLTDATWLAAVKGAVAGPVNLGLALLLGAALPAGSVLVAGGLVGLLSYGVSLVLFITSLRLVGTARAGAYFSVAPFFGALLAIGLGDPPSWAMGLAGLLMAAGVGLHLSERHEHEHTHEPLDHDHWHTHDEGHHGHDHPFPVSPGTRHRHRHVHQGVTHAHPHFPDAHHRHRH